MFAEKQVLLKHAFHPRLRSGQGAEFRSQMLLESTLNHVGVWQLAQMTPLQPDCGSRSASLSVVSCNQRAASAAVGRFIEAMASQRLQSHHHCQAARSAVEA